MATVKNAADLQTDADSSIGSQTAPDSITPIIVADRLKDIDVSFWNKLDGINVSPVNVPGWLASQLADGDKLETFIQVILDELTYLSNNDSTMPPQARPGLFLATLETAIPQTFRLNTVGDVAPVIISNDSKDGAFDNGNNWSTFNYKAPLAGTYKFLLTGVAVELVKKVTATNPADMIFEIRKNGTLISSATKQITWNNSYAEGDIQQVQSIYTSAVSLAKDDVVSVVVKSSTVGGDYIVKINSASFSNEDQ